jgi:hypothetical protein
LLVCGEKRNSEETITLSISDVRAARVAVYTPGTPICLIFLQTLRRSTPGR